MSHLAQIDRVVADRHLLGSAFYKAWSRGDLTKAALQSYARQYFKHVAAFPTYLSAVHSRTEDMPTRKMILENLVEEEAGSPNHPELWLQFANGMGTPNEEVLTEQAWPETNALVEAFKSACEAGTIEGLAALYAYESQIPAVCVSKIEGLQAHYGVTDAKTYRYFTDHLEADEDHAATGRAWLEAHLTDENAPRALAAVEKVTAALLAMLDAVCTHNAIAA
ncbi:MAG TPA: CADD family putative folate metabolism protein [Polyangiaceae bacterium]